MCTLLLTAALLLTACETIVEIDLPTHTPQIVVNSVFGPGQMWRVHVSRSADIFDNARPAPLRDARVELWEGDQLLAVLAHQGDGFYGTHAFLPAPGRTYVVRASAPSLADAEARSTVPADASVAVAVRRLPGGSHGVHSPMEISVAIQDPPDEKNYYHFSIVSIFSHEGQQYRYPVLFKLLDRSIAESQVTFDIFGSDYFSDLLFSDTHFDGRTYELQAIIHSEVVLVETELYIEISVVTEEYFKYQRSASLQRTTAENPFAEPVQVYSNVQNGLGIFAAVNMQRWRVRPGMPPSHVIRP